MSRSSSATFARPHCRTPGVGAGVYADALARVRSDLEVTLIGLPDRNGRNHAGVAAERRNAVRCVDTPAESPVDLTIAVDLIGAHPDDDARTVAASARRSSPSPTFSTRPPPTTTTPRTTCWACACTIRASDRDRGP
ncbi:hypothetical protein [Rhodococcus sp. SORGH_AS_0301]|uniref:hypothetical protein n=1 Tax=Rhodococcus sp. SORGH_AS_0301 TaxID=3041780 RepID=UPI00278089A7|nr:hypothetical protein [Rhodococcus sp. SORGH_AS_0301]MDQ1181858.1 hypothetical protein [Rhodococcus sp. SORGH_AS_0301]